MVGRKRLGPSFRRTTGRNQGCSKTYVMKNTKTMIEYRSPIRTRSTPIPAMAAIPVLVRSIRLTQYMNPRVSTSPSVDTVYDFLLLFRSESMDALVILPIRLCGLNSSDVFNGIAFVVALLRLT